MNQLSPSKPGSMEDAIKLWLKVSITYGMDKLDDTVF